MHEKMLSELIIEFAQKNPDNAPTTKWRRADLWRQLIDVTGDKPVRDFAYGDAEDFQVHLKSRHKPSTVKTGISTVQAVFNWAMRRGYCLENPFAGVPKVRVPKREIRVYDDAEVSAMLDEAPNIMWRARIMASLSAGLRKGEVLNLTVRDIDFDRGEIHVRAKKEGPDTWRWKTKNGCDRTVPLTDSLANVLTELIAELSPGQPYLMLTEKRYYHLLARRRVGRLPEHLRRCPDDYGLPWKRLLEKIAVTGRFHDLRATCITRWTQSLAPQETQKLAGHSNIETTLTYYAAVRDDFIERAMRCSIC